MKINVTENKVSIKEEQILNENEYNIHKIQFDFSSEYTDDLVKVALFSIDNHTYKKIISNNECDIPPEVLTQRGYSILGVYAYKTEQDTLVLRYSPSPTKISVYDGSYKADAENSEPITPSEIEQYQQILQNSLQQFQNQYNALVEETEGDIQAIEDELQRKVDEGYFNGEDGFSPIAKVIQKSNGATIEIEDKNGKTTADVLNGEDGYTPVRGVDYWTEEDKQEVEEEATQQIEGKIEEYNENAAEKLNQYNQNSVQKTNDYNTNAEQKMSTYNTNATEKLSTYNSNATEKFNSYNSNAEQKETNYNTNASQKVESFNTNASSKLSEYNSNAETKKSAYDENATQKTNSFNTNATNKLTEYNTNHTEKMSAYNSNSTEKLNAFNENATQKTEDFDEHTEEIQDNIETLEAQNERLRNTLPTTTAEGQDVTLDKTAELEFKKPPLPMGNSEQVQYSGKNKLKVVDGEITVNGVTLTIENQKLKFNGTASGYTWISILPQIKSGTTTDNDNPLFNSENMNYTISVQNIKGQLGNGSNLFFTMLINQTQKAFDIALNTTQTIPFENENLYAIWFLITGGTTFNNYEFNIQIEEGSTATSYEPYVGGTASPNPAYPQEITNVTGDVEVKVQNKNLWNTNFKKGGYDMQGNFFPTDKVWITNSLPITVNSNTQYTITQKETPTSYRISFFNNETYLSYFAMAQELTHGYKSCTFTTPANCNKIYVSFRSTKEIISSGTYDMDVTDITNVQLEKGSTSTDYVPHKEQVLPLTLGNIELCKIGDYQDYFYKESNKWYLHKEIKKILLNGTEYWLISNNVFYLTSISDYINSSGKICLSDKYTAINNTNVGTSAITQNNSICFFNTNTNPRLYIRDERFNNVNDFETELSENNVKVYYPTVTPTDTEITDTTLISQLEAINNALSYEEQTNISSNQNALFDVEAYLDSKEVIDEKYTKPSTGIPKTDLASDVQTSLNKADSALQEHQDISGKQDITDNTLTTINKTVPTAINEVNSIAKLANQAKSYSTYQAFINYLNTAEKTEFIPGQSFMIQTKLVPDLWVYSVENTSVQYTYTTDEDFITYTNQATGGQVGYYKLAQLETQKVDLTDYATKTYVNNLFNSIVDGDEVSY